MGEGLLLAVEVPATVFTEEMAFIRGCGGWTHGAVTDCGMSTVLC